MKNDQQKSISFLENSEIGVLSFQGLTGKKIQVDDKETMKKIYQFRYQIIIEELKWLSPAPQKEDKDIYDLTAEHFAVFEGDKIIGYVRVIKGNSLMDFMLGCEFKKLIAYRGSDIAEFLAFHKNQCVEISRLIVHPDYRKSFVEEMLYKLIAQWSWKRKAFYWFIVVSQEFYSYYCKKRHFILHKWGEGHIHADAKMACVATTLDLRKSADNIRKHDQKIASFLLEGLEEDSA